MHRPRVCAYVNVVSVRVLARSHICRRSQTPEEKDSSSPNLSILGVSVALSNRLPVRSSFRSPLPLLFPSPSCPLLFIVAYLLYDIHDILISHYALTRTTKIISRLIGGREKLFPIEDLYLLDGGRGIRLLDRKLLSLCFK